MGFQQIHPKQDVLYPLAVEKPILRLPRLVEPPRGPHPDINRIGLEVARLRRNRRNLIRRDLTIGQRSKLLAQRKAIYLKDFLETGRGKAPVGRGGKKRTAKFASHAAIGAEVWNFANSCFVFRKWTATTKKNWPGLLTSP